MTEEQRKKYIAKVAMTNYVSCMLAIEKSTRKITELFLTGGGLMTPDSTKAAYFSDTFSAFMFLRSAPFDAPKIPEEYEIIPHSNYYREVTVELLYLPKDENGQYKVDTKYTFFGNNDLECVFSAAGNTTLRTVINNQQLVGG